MRIISGSLGGRRINPPANMPFTRPTTDIAKEGLFNILQNNIDFDDLKTLDLFGGTGSISFELTSRGAADLTIVEKDPNMSEFINQTATNFKIQNLKLIRSDVFNFIEQCTDQFDLIFAGPPYALQNIDDLPTLIFEKKLLTNDGWFILEHTPANNYENFTYFRTSRNYGTTIFSIFVNQFATTE
jgi:16S rRNA (guanine(966)-N(2))-methyltransferase RsmD